MKRFSFRLERLRRLREASEQESARALGEARREEDERRRALDRWIQRREQARDQASHASNSRDHTLPAGTLAALGVAADACNTRVVAAEAEFKAAEERTESERQNYAKARKDRRVLDRLRERQWNRWRDEVAHEEQAMVDETAARNSKPAGGHG